MCGDFLKESNFFFSKNALWNVISGCHENENWKFFSHFIVTLQECINLVMMIKVMLVEPQNVHKHIIVINQCYSTQLLTWKNNNLTFLFTRAFGRQIKWVKITCVLHKKNSLKLTTIFVKFMFVTFQLFNKMVKSTHSTLSHAKHFAS